MPYIKQGRRELFNDAGLDRVLNLINDTGDLNYCITYLASRYAKRYPFTYGWLSSIRGAISDAAEEFYRRIIVPYEENKKLDNGDVY